MVSHISPRMFWHKRYLLKFITEYSGLIFLQHVIIIIGLKSIHIIFYLVTILFKVHSTIFHYYLVNFIFPLIVEWEIPHTLKGFFFHKQVETPLIRILSNAVCCLVEYIYFNILSWIKSCFQGNQLLVIFFLYVMGVLF